MYLSSLYEQFKHLYLRKQGKNTNMNPIYHKLNYLLDYY